MLSGNELFLYLYKIDTMFYYNGKTLMLNNEVINPNDIS